MGGSCHPQGASVGLAVMEPGRWQRIWDLFARATALEPERRDAILAEACGGDETARREVASLLARDAAPGNLFAGAVEEGGARPARRGRPRARLRRRGGGPRRGRPDRGVRDRPTARPRRYGRGPRDGARRRGLPPAGRRQGHPPRPRQPGPGGPVPHRAADPRPAEPPEYRPPPRRRHHAGRRALRRGSSGGHPSHSKRHHGPALHHSSGAPGPNSTGLGPRGGGSHSETRRVGGEMRRRKAICRPNTRLPPGADISHSAPRPAPG